MDVLPWEDVRGETALLHFLASSSLQHGDKKGQEVQQFQVGAPKELGNIRFSVMRSLGGR